MLRPQCVSALVGSVPLAPTSPLPQLHPLLGFELTQEVWRPPAESRNNKPTFPQGWAGPDKGTEAQVGQWEETPPR